MSRTLQGLAVACAVGLLAAGVWADDKDRKDKPHALDDATFVKKAASDNMHEVKMGELGAKRATATEVKEFAQKMVKDHSKSLDDLKKAAKAAKFDVPAKMSKEHEDHVAHLDKHDGKDFDAVFVSHMVRDHEKAVTLFEQASKDLKNDELRRYAEKTLPVIREHLKMARKLNEKYGKEKSDRSDKGGGKGEKDRPVKDRPFKDR